MKPRVLFSDGRIRVVCSRYSFHAEQANGRDKVGQTRWVDVTNRVTAFEALVESIGKTLIRREKARRKARRAGK